LASEAPLTNYATLNFRNYRPILEFDDTTDESTYWTRVLPSNYRNNGLRVRILWCAASATSGTCRWEVAFERIAEGGLDIDSDSFASSKSAGGTANATSGKLTYTSISFSVAETGSIAAGESFRLKINRDADGSTGTDDMVGDANILVVELMEP